MSEIFSVFADESGTHASEPCYGIGALIVPKTRLERFNEFFRGRKEKHKTGSEPCWVDIDRSYADMNLAIDLLKAIMSVDEARFSIAVVKKAIFKKWLADPADGFWTSYHYLLVSLARLKPGDYEVTLDPRTDKYKKHNEVLEVIGNNVLRQSPDAGVIQNVAWGESATDPGIQAADMLTGAIVASHNVGLMSTRRLNGGKRLLIGRLAAILGWRDLYCDTRPNPKFNIWHFPDRDGSAGWRAVPETREVAFRPNVPLVGRGDVAALRRG
jgi:hypothetical protein